MHLVNRKTVIGIISVIVAFNALAVFAHGDEGHEAKNNLNSEQEEFGQLGVEKNITRTINVSMGDTMRFVPETMQFAQGETVRLQFTNTGKSAHEFILGTPAEITEHAELMRKFPDMKHADASSVRVEAGKTATIIWQFNRAGEFVYACLIPGHSEAGMRGTVTVVPMTNAKATNAQTTKADAETIPVANSSTATNTGDLTEGIIRKVDVAQNKITIKHGDIKNLDMPGMTMIFRVSDPSMLSSLKSGDAIAFRAEKLNGGLTVTRIELAK
jgi:uncharacterized cupredoxin-like copper-binding protein/Cu/Ag efflux protein CusF